MDVRTPLALAFLTLAGTLGGCSVVNYPPVGGQSAGTNLNEPAPRLAIATALLWATRRYPPVAGESVDHNQPFAFSLPPGIDTVTYRAIARDVAAGNPLAQPVLEGNTDLPTYYVVGVMVRHSDAEVSILCPQFNLGPGTQGEQLYRGVSVEMRGGWRPWQYHTHRTFLVNTADVPERNVVLNEFTPPQ